MEALYRSDSRRVLATLIRLLGTFGLAEEALHDAFTAAMEQWPQGGVPAYPRAWLVSTGRHKAIDSLRRRARFDASVAELAAQLSVSRPEDPGWAEQGVEDDRLRLIFVCCHPALPPRAQIALTLREVCGLTTEQIARAFLTTTPTIAQRIVRAKAKIRDARIPYELPARNELPARLDSVLRVIYLVFNEGYSATSGESLTRPDVLGEAIRLGRLLFELLPGPEVTGLLALMLLHESRRAARTSASGELILFEHQDRSLWNRELVAEGCTLAPAAGEDKGCARFLPTGPGVNTTGTGAPVSAGTSEGTGGLRRRKLHLQSPGSAVPCAVTSYLWALASSAGLRLSGARVLCKHSSPACRSRRAAFDRQM